MNISLVSTRKRQVPAEYRSNFNHLVMDIAWFGVLNGSAIAFVTVYATRIGASALQLSLMAALPAIVNLVLALPAGRWLQGKPVDKATVITAVFNRWFYVLWVFLPIWFVPATQIWMFVVITLLMSIPGTALAISFNALFAGAVPPEWRAQVAGVRNAAYAMSSILITLLCGWLLNSLSFPLGYQIVFLIGLIGAIMSGVHLLFVHPVDEPTLSNGRMRLRDWAEPGILHTWNSVRTTVGLRFLMRNDTDPSKPNQWLAPISNSRYKQALLIVFCMHLTMYLAIPLFPLMLVNELNLSDEIIALGNGIFYAALFLGSLQHDAVASRLGNRRTLALGLVIMGSYPILVSQANGAALYLIAAVLGGAGWSLAGAAVGNYVLQEAPEDQRPAYLAWYNMALQAGILLGALTASSLSAAWTVSGALLVAGISRILAGVLAWYEPRRRLTAPGSAQH